MKTSLIASSLLAAAASVSAQDYNQSAPFELILLSKNSTINGTSLIACHEGAAIEGLCLGGTSGIPAGVTSTFQFNSTSASVVADPDAGTPGLLTYELEGGNFNTSEPLGLYYTPTSNVAIPLFEPGEGYGETQVAFDECGLLNIQSYIDDTVFPPTTNVTTAHYRWYACQTYFTGYTYTTLAWVVGNAPPQNPTCQAVNVTRSFV